jgi:hypothetical protein
MYQYYNTDSFNIAHFRKFTQNNPQKHSMNYTILLNLKTQVAFVSSWDGIHFTLYLTACNEQLSITFILTITCNFESVIY